MHMRNENRIQYAPPKLKCRNQVYCKTGSADFHEVLEYICDSLRDCIADFEMRIDTKQDDSVKLHKNLITDLEKKMREPEAKELSQWESQSDPNPNNRIPQHIFQQLNEKRPCRNDGALFCFRR